MPNLAQRLERIEEVLSPSRVVFAWREPGETPGETRARFIRERPEAAGQLITVIGWIDNR